MMEYESQIVRHFDILQDTRRPGFERVEAWYRVHELLRHYEGTRKNIYERALFSYSEYVIEHQ